MKKLIDCPACNIPVSPLAKSCPACGQPIAEKKPHIGAFSYIGLLGFVVFGGYGLFKFMDAMFIDAAINLGVASQCLFMLMMGRIIDSIRDQS